MSQDANGGLDAINGETSTSAPASTTASVTAGQAATLAKSATANANKVAASALVASAPALSIYDPALFGQSDGLGSRPVFQTIVTDPANPAINQYVLVDARTDTIALSFSQTATPFATTKAVATSAKPAVAPKVSANFTADVSVCDFGEAINPDEICTSPVADPADSPVTDVKDAYEYTGAVNDFYNNVTGRKGIDGNNMPVISSVDFCPDSSDCPYANSFWDGSQMMFGQGFPEAPDVVAHEYTHGVTQYTSGLLYYYQSGSINESMSDVMGELFDQYNGTDTNDQWIFGENLPFDFQRNMADPTQSGQGAQPDAMSSPYWSTDGWDSGGVHTDSGVGNKLAYLAAEGTNGTAFHGVNVVGIANDGQAAPNMIQKMANIWLLADTMLTPAADYADLGNAVQGACASLQSAGTDGVVASDCQSVTAAVAATQLESTTSSHLPAQTTVCSTGYNPGIVFADNFNRAPSTTLGPNWYDSGPPEIDAFAASTVATGDQLYIPEVANDTTPITRYAYTKLITLPSTQTSYLSFQHLDSLDWFDGPHADGGSSVYMEGMYIEYQLSGTTTWKALPATWVNGPTKTVDKTHLSGNTLFIDGTYPGTAFAGDSQGWAYSRATISTTLKGKTVRFRFRTQSDGFNWPTSSYGEFIDNVSVNDCVKAPLAPTGVHVAGYHGSATLAWGTASANGGTTVTSYHVYIEDIGHTGFVATTVSASTRSHAFTGLVNGHDYAFEVRAENSAGQYSPFVTVSLPGTNLTLTATPTSITSGTPVTLTGALTKVDDGTPFVTRGVTLYYRKHGTTTWTAQTAVAVTNASGVYTFTVKPTTSEDYYVQYSAGSPSAMGVTSAIVTVTLS